MKVGDQIYNPSEFFQRNEKLKAAHSTEYVTVEEFQRRTKEIVKCKNDIKHFANKYFYIIGADGKQIIPLYPRQAELLDFLVANSRIIVKCPRQCGKTTANSILALWYAIFNNDKRLLVVANKQEIVFEILERIQFAYEELPFWLKPGITSWNKKKISFSNGSVIEGTSTTSTAARGKSAEVVLIDELAWIPNNLLEPFLVSILPIASSFKNSKIIGVSTPNGVNNKFYELYSAAELNVDNTEGWKKFDICLDDVPGRDEDWRKARLAEFNGDLVKYAQEYECVFHGSSYTLLKKETIKAMKDFVLSDKWIEPTKVQLNQNFSFDQYHKPIKDHCYILMADPSSGVGLDFSVVLVFDVTTTADICHVASFASNTVSTLEFPYVIVKMAILYNRAPIAMESNSIGDGILNSIAYTYEYDNIVNYEEQKGKLGIFSHVQVKGKACRWLRDLISFPIVNVRIYDKILVAEMEWFERKNTPKHEIYQAVGTKHDDFMMAFIWGMFCLNPDIVESIFNVTKYAKIKEIGLDIPLFLQSMNSSYFSEFGFGGDDHEVNPDEVYNTQLFGKNTATEKISEEDMPKVLGFTEGDGEEEDYSGSNEDSAEQFLLQIQ